MNLGQRVLELMRAALVWMVSWASVGALLSIVVGIVDPPSIDAGEGPADLARVFGAVGAACGAIFGLLLAVAERRRKVADVPLPRAALWGVLAGAAVPLLTGLNDQLLANTCPLGVVTGLSFVAVARLGRRRCALPA